MKKLTIEEAYRLAEKHNGKCLSINYVNCDDKLDWRCENGHKFKMSLHLVKKGHWCPKCAGNKKLTLSHVRKVAKERGGKCLSQEYINSKTKLKWQCKFGHIWEATYNNINRGKWCPQCKISRSEDICRIYFEQIFKKKFPKHKPSWLIGINNYQLELDGYCKELNIAFEHNGDFHYKDLFKKYNNFLIVKKNDKIKKDLCKKHGIKLIIIPQLFKKIKLVELLNYIKSECAKRNIQFPNITQININKIYKNNYTNDRLELFKKIAKNNNGKLLSKTYIDSRDKLEFQCKNGHKWFAWPDNIIRGCWCKLCYLQRKNINE